MVDIKNSSNFEFTDLMFLSISDFEQAVNDNQINYDDFESDVRLGLYTKNGQKWCREYFPIANCAKYDDSSLDQTF